MKKILFGLSLFFILIPNLFALDITRELDWFNVDIPDSYEFQHEVIDNGHYYYFYENLEDGYSENYIEMYSVNALTNSEFYTNDNLDYYFSEVDSYITNTDSIVKEVKQIGDNKYLFLSYIDDYDATVEDYVFYQGDKIFEIYFTSYDDKYYTDEFITNVLSSIKVTKSNNIIASEVELLGFLGLLTIFSLSLIFIEKKRINDEDEDKGLKGAILAGLSIVGVWAMTEVYLGVYSVLIAIFLFQFMKYSYNLFGGKDGTGKIKLLVIGLLFLLLSETFSILLSLARDGYQVSLDSLINILKEPAVLKEVGTSLITASIIMMLGFFGILDRKKNKEELKEV